MQKLLSVLLAAIVCAAFAGEEQPAPVGPLKPVSRGGVYVCKTLKYGPRQVGAGAAHKSVAQTYDLYLPAAPGKIRHDAPVYLSIHGGAWSEGSKEDDAWLMPTLASRGFVAITMNYALCAPKLSGDVGFDRMLRDVDLMVSHLPALLKAIGLGTDRRIALGGLSSGGHLALTYAYDAADPAVLGLGLRHAMKIGCVYSDCGPADLTTPEFVVAGIDSMKGTLAHWAGQFGVLTGGNRGETDMAALADRLRKYSPAALVSAKAPPTILLYGEAYRVKTSGTYDPGDGRRKPYTELWRMKGAAAPESVGTDGVVASQGFVALTNRLASCGVPHFARLSPVYHCKSIGSDPMLAFRVCRLLQDCLLTDNPKMD